MTKEGYRTLEEAITKYPGGMSKRSLGILTEVAKDMGRYSIEDEILKRVIVTELDDILNHFRQSPIDSTTIEIAIKRSMAALSLRERPRGFENNRPGNKALEEAQRAILENEAIKIIRERNPERVPTPVIHMDPANSIDAFVRFGWTVQPQYAPIPHRLSQLVVNKSLHFENKEIDEAIEAEPQDETQIEYVRKNLGVLKNLTGFTPRAPLDRLL